MKLASYQLLYSALLSKATNEKTLTLLYQLSYMDYKSPRMGSNQRHMAYKAKYVLSTALAFKFVRQQAARVLNYTSEPVTGIEPATFGTGNRRSNHCEVFLTYGTHVFVFQR